MREHDYSLTDDLWLCIALKLNPADRVKFRAVCKSWNSLLPQLPWLMLADTDGKPLKEPLVIEVEEEEDDDDEDIEVQYEEGHIEPRDFDMDDEYYDDVDDSQYSSSSEESQEKVVPSPPLGHLPPRGFVLVGDQQVSHIDFPEIHRAVCIGSTGNWLITMHENKTIRLLNPFSRQHFYLPSQARFEHSVSAEATSIEQNHIWKVVLSSPPSSGQDCIAVAIYNVRRILAIARLGDPRWTTLECDYVDDPKWNTLPLDDDDDDYPDQDPYSGIADVIFCKGKFYALSCSGELYVCDIQNGLNPPRVVRLSGIAVAAELTANTYLVECLDDLLMVIKYLFLCDPNEDRMYGTYKIEVYKFDFIRRNWDSLKSLGEYSLFVGLNTSISLRASDYCGQIKKNCVYFTDDYRMGYLGTETAGGHDMGVYNLEDNTIHPHFTGVSTSFYSPPIWIVPPPRTMDQ